MASIEKSANRRLLWIARICAGLTIAFLLLIFIGESFGSKNLPTSSEWIGLLFFPLGLVVGLIVTWWREGIGAVIALCSMAAFYLWNYADSGSWPSGPFFPILTVPAVLFLIYHILKKKN